MGQLALVDMPLLVCSATGLSQLIGHQVTRSVYLQQQVECVAAR